MIEKISAENACEAARYIMTEYYRLNVEPFFSVLSQNCVWILPGGQIVIGAEAIRAMFQDGFIMPPFQAEDVEFDLLNTGSPEQIGVFGTYALFSDVKSEMILAGKQRVTMMFRKEKDGFRLYHLHTSNEWHELAEGEIFPALAAEAEPYTGGLCPHHQEHSFEDCGYIEAVEGQPCDHVHDGDCGFVEAVPEVLCDMDCAEPGEDGQIIHAEGCAYAPEVEGAPCQHEHDGECGYVEAVEGQPCGYVCPTCSMQAGNDDLPMLAADETGAFTVTGGALGKDYSYADNILTILTDAALTISGNTTRDRIVVEGGIEANITLNNLSIRFSDGSETDRNHLELSGTCVFAVGRSTVCNLTLVGDNTLQSGYHQAALEVPGNTTLTIEGPGTITANGGKRAAGIGGSRRMDCGTITINSGTVEAHGSTGGAGIGGGSDGTGGSGDSINRVGNGGIVTINGGTVTATATNFPGTSATGIGGGPYSENNGTLTITDGTLKDANVESNEFTMTGGTLEGCTILYASVPLNNATIRNSTLNNLSSWTDANNTVSGSTLNFKRDVAQITLTRGGAGNTYNIPVTITDNASFSGNTTFGSTVDITGNVTLDGITELTGNVTISAGGSLTNKGTLTVPGDCTITNHATITNNEGAVINLSGVIDNQTDPAGTVANNGTIFLIGTGRVLGEDRLTGNSPVSVGTVPIPAGEIVIDMSEVRNTVTIGPESYTIDGTSHTYDPAQNNIVLTGTYNNFNMNGTWDNHAAAVTVLENTTAGTCILGGSMKKVNTIVPLFGSKTTVPLRSF